MKPLRNEVKIGIAAILTLAILFFGIDYLKGIDIFQSTSRYYVLFPNAGGLTESTPILADGYRVGIVRHLRYDYHEPQRVVAEIEVNPALRIPKGSSAELASDLLGNMKMSLILARNPLESIPRGDTIPGRVNGGLMDEAAGMVPVVMQMMPKLDSILSSLQTLLADPALPAILHNVDGLTASLDRNSRSLEGLMNRDIPQLTAKLGTLGDNLITITDNLKQVDYAAAMQRVDSTLANVRALTDRLQRAEGTAGLLLNDPTLYNNLSATAANAASLLEDLQNHPKRYVHFSLFGKKDK